MINVWEDWYINADRNQYILGQINPERTEKGKQSILLNESYHITIAQACTHLLRILQRQYTKQNHMAAIGAVKELNKIHETLESKFKEIISMDNRGAATTLATANGNLFENDKVYG